MLFFLNQKNKIKYLPKCDCTEIHVFNACNFMINNINSCLWTEFITLSLDSYKMSLLFQLDFWKVPHLNTSVDIHVPIHMYNDVTKHLSRVGLHPSLLINDLQRCVQNVYGYCLEFAFPFVPKWIKKSFFKEIIRSYQYHLFLIIIWSVFNDFM